MPSRTRITILTLVAGGLITATILVMFFKKEREFPPLSKDMPDVILISIDTLRADRLGCYGSTTVATPHIDALAARGALFAQVAAQVPITLPSHASIFTGLNPLSHNVRENGTFRLADADTTLAEVLKSRGYTNAAFIGGFPLDARFGLDQGFDVYDDDFSQKKSLMSGGRQISWQGHQVAAFERRAGDVIDAVTAWLEKNREKSFFLFIHVYDPHQPYAPPSEFMNQYRAHPYDGEVAYVDVCLGKLFSSLTRLKLRENALIVITSDHGESLGEHNYRGHGERLYEPSLWIPLIMAYPPKIPPGTRIEPLLRSIDIMPTLLDLLDITSESEMQGISALPLLNENGPPQDRRTAYGETIFPRMRYGRPELMSFRDENWKYIRAVQDGQIVKEALYDLLHDPQEIQDLASQESERLQDLSQRLDIVMARDTEIGRDKKTGLAMDEETRRKLKSLGYIR